MMIEPTGAGDSWLRHDLREHLKSVRDNGYMCEICCRLPEPVNSVAIEVRDMVTLAVIGRASYCTHCYHNQGQAFDRDNRYVLVYRGAEFFV